MFTICLWFTFYNDSSLTEKVKHLKQVTRVIKNVTKIMLTLDSSCFNGFHVMPHLHTSQWCKTVFIWLTITTCTHNDLFTLSHVYDLFFQRTMFTTKVYKKFSFDTQKVLHNMQVQTAQKWLREKTCKTDEKLQNNLWKNRKTKKLPVFTPLRTLGEITQSKLNFICIVTVPYKTSVQNFNNRSSTVSEIWELSVHNRHKVMP